MIHLRLCVHAFVASALFYYPGISMAADSDSTQTSEVFLVVGNFLPEEGGPAPAPTPPSPLQSPFGVDFDRTGNMFIVELEGGRVFRRSPAGEVLQVSGDGSKSYRGDGGPFRNATYNGMHNVAVGRDDALYIADSWNHGIRRVDPQTGLITTLAGTGRAGFGGDNGPAAQAVFNFLMCVSMDPKENRLIVTDLNNRRIREVTLRTGQVKTLAGNGRKGVPVDGALAVDSPLVDPRAADVDMDGNLYILERGGHALRVVDVDGRITTVVGTGQAGRNDGQALQARINSPKHLCLDDAGRVYIADEGNALIRRYDPRTQTVTTILGNGQGRPAVRLSRPHGVCFEKGWLYVVDTGHDRVLKMKVTAP